MWKIKTRWLIVVYKEGTIYDICRDFSGFYPAEEEITKFCKEDNYIILSMQRIKYGKFGFVFGERVKLNKT